MTGVQWYVLFGGIALNNHAFVLCSGGYASRFDSAHIQGHACFRNAFHMKSSLAVLADIDFFGLIGVLKHLGHLR